MEQLDLFIQQFYALPQVASVVESNGVLRLAVNQYGKPLFLITCAFIFLVMILLISRLKPKKGRPKKIKEPKAKPVKAAKPARRPKKAKGTPKSVMKNLAKIPDSPLPLYPVADKRKPLSIDDDLAVGVMPVVDDSSLIASLDHPDPVDDAPKPIVSSQPVQSFTLDASTAAAMTNVGAGTGTSTASSDQSDFNEDFIMPVATENDMTDNDNNNEDELFFEDTEDDDPDLGIHSDFGGFGAEASDHIEDDAEDSFEDDFAEDGEDDFIPIEDITAPENTPEDTKPKHEVTVDVSPIGGDDFDMPVGSFGGDDAGGDDQANNGGLSPSAQQKLAELNERGST